MLKINLSVVFVINLIYGFALGNFEATPVSQIKIVINEINRNFFAIKSTSVRIITAKDDHFLKDLTSSGDSSLSFELIESQEIRNLSLTVSDCNIIQITSLENFKEILSNISSEKFKLDGFFLIVYQNCLKIDSSQLFAEAWKRYIYNINALCQNDDIVSIKTFMPFQSDSCGNTTSMTVNTVENDLMINVFPEKLKTLHGCPIKVATFYYPPITMRETLDNGSFRYYGSEMDLVFGLAEALNFSIDMTYIAQSGFTGLLYENGTATGILKETIEGDKDMLMGFYYLTYQRTRFLSFTQSHYSIPLIIMIPLGEPLTSFEKIFRPFQNVVWLFLIITLGSGVVVIAIINCQSNFVKDFIFGDGIRHAYLNMINIIVGGSQHILPKKNFARSLLMMFLLFCIVQRSIYQSSLYLFLQSDGRNPAVTTIDEMIEKRFVFYVRETLEHNIKHLNFYNKRKTVQFADYPELRLRTLDASFKGGIIQPLLEVIYLNQQNYKNFTFNVLKEYLFDVQIVNYFPKNFYLVEPINDNIGILKAAGLVDLWMERFIDKSYIKIKQQKTNAKIMNIQQLLGGFQILLFGLVLAIGTFCIELITTTARFRKVSKYFGLNNQGAFKQDDQ